MSTQSLKPGWKMVKFGDIAQNVAVRVDPADAKTDVYVGLEHLDPSTIHLRQWGHPSDVTGQKLAFKKGDVIFGRRRAYQRKLAIAEFDGICSAHAMVVRAKPKMILPEFLPFFLHSDMFMERAIEISVGSLSPTINWKTLKVQEFPLPPIDEQKRIAEILWAADEAHESYKNVLSESEKALELLRDRILSGHFKILADFGVNQFGDGDSVQVSVGEVVRFQGGSQPPRDTFEYKPRDGVVRLIQIRDYKSDEFITYVPQELARRFCDEKDVMIGRYGPPIFQILRGINGAYNVALIKAVPDESRLSKDYLFYFLKQRKLFEAIDHLSRRSSGQTGIDMDFLKKYPLPLPKLEIQHAIVGLFKSFEEKQELIRGHCQNYSQLKKGYFQQTIGDAHV